MLSALKGNQKQDYEEIRNYFACKDLPENIRQKAGQYQREAEESAYAITIRESFIKEKKAVHNLGLIRRFVMFIIKLMKAYYGRSMRRVRKMIGRKPETELPLILAVLRALFVIKKS